MLIDDLSNEHEALKQTKVENEAKLEYEMKRRDESTEELEDAQHGLEMKGRQCTEWTEIYKRETEQRFFDLFFCFLNGFLDLRNLKPSGELLKSFQLSLML